MTTPSHWRHEAPTRSTNSGNSGSRNYDVERVGHTKRDSLGILNLSFAATEREIKVVQTGINNNWIPNGYDVEVLFDAPINCFRVILTLTYMTS